MKQDEILEGVKECLGTALDMSPGTISEGNKIIDDLGADSLDLLDLVFQLEQRFHIRISPRDIERRTQEKLGEKPVHVDGVYSPEALRELRQVMPEVPAEELAEGLTQAELPYRFRVATMVHLVQRLLEEQGGEPGKEAQDV